MGGIKRSTLFGKLNRLCYKAVESATVFCKLRGNPYVELIHWLQQMLQLQDSDLHRVIRHFGIEAARLSADLTTALDALPSGATAIADFSPHLEQAVERSWVYTTLLFKDNRIRSGYLLFGILNTPGLKNVLLASSREWERIQPEVLASDFGQIVYGSPEDRRKDEAPVSGEAVAAGTDSMSPASMGKQEALSRFSMDLTEQAGRGEIDPVLERDDEIRQIIDILMRRRQNNPILTGEAGVGKTAVVEGFAQKIVSGEVPPSLREVTVRSLDLGLLQAGASMRGEFEERLKQLIEEVQSSEKPIILFIDEAHNLMGAGGVAGQGDAANLLKPALARGTLRTIAATTWSEYKKYFEKDAALTRRFQVVKVEEPSEQQAVAMLRGSIQKWEQHHKVQVLDEALEAAVQLSHRYVPARQLPDKAVSLIDTACARVAMRQYAALPQVEDVRRRIAALEREIAVLEKEMAWGKDHSERKDKLLKALAAEKKRAEELKAREQQEHAHVSQIIELQKKLNEEVADDPAVLLAKLREQEKALAAVQGETPLIMLNVDKAAVAAVVADWTGIPVGRMVKDEIQAVLDLVDHLERRVVGQRHALETIAKRILTSRAGLDNPNKPVGVFLLAGTSGIGKTETALALADTLYGGEHHLITFNMSEFQEAHTVSTLKGAPPGYVGYGEGGALTEAVRRRPYSVVLLDEIEKTHPDVHEIFFQVFDKGEMEDAEGRHIDFKNTIIILTTNVGSERILRLCKDRDQKRDPDAMVKALWEPLLQVFPAALLGRMITVPFYPLRDTILKKIIELQMGRIKKRLEERHKIEFSYDPAVCELIASRCTEVESGGRMIDAILTNTLLPEISKAFLTHMMEACPIKRVHVSVQNKAFEYTFE